MNPIDFVDSIYLGDRGCLKIVLDGIKKEIWIQVDNISRIRSPDGKWNYYNDENIENGYIVFEDVYSIDWSGDKRIPNDYIGCLIAKKREDERYNFTFSSNSVDDDGSVCDVTLKIVAVGIYLIDPARPGVQIKD